MAVTKDRAFRVQSGVSLNDKAYVFEGEADATTAFTAYGNPPAGSVYIQYLTTNPVIYLKTGTLPSNWRIISLGDWLTLMNRPDGDDLIMNFTNKYLTFPHIPNPDNIAANTLRLYGHNIAGRMFPKWKGPSGMDQPMQALIAMNKVAWWNPAGNSTTVPGSVGMIPYTTSGTLTARTVSTTNMFTRMKRLGNTSTGIASMRQVSAQFTIGDGAGLGGFLKIVRFGSSDESAVTSARMFVGMTASTSSPSSVNPATLTYAIGVGHNNTDTNLKIYYAGSSPQAPIDLGPDFPVSPSNTNPYELILFSASNSVNLVGYRVTRLSTGHVAEGFLQGSVAGRELPDSDTLLTMTMAWRARMSGSGRVGLEFMSDYIETDY